MYNLSVEAINQLRRDTRSVVREFGLLNDAYFGIGVTLAERHLLIELHSCPSPTMKEISQRLLLEKSTVSRLIANAVKKGFVRCITDTQDKRKRLLILTEKGKQTLDAFEPIAFNQAKEALLTLTPEESKTVHEGIALYAKSLKNSRTQNKDKKDLCSKKIETLPEIFHCLSELGYTLELFDKKDEKGLYEIFQEAVDSGSQFPYECSPTQEFHHQFFNPERKVYVCHSQEGEVVAGFYLKVNYSGRSNHIANAAYMVHQTYRGKGIGSLLVKASLHFAKDLGFQAMQFNMVLSENKRAVQLYERLGFTIVGIIPKAVRNLDGSFQDGYVMHRGLEDLGPLNFLKT